MMEININQQLFHSLLTKEYNEEVLPLEINKKMKDPLSYGELLWQIVIEEVHMDPDPLVLQYVVPCTIIVGQLQILHPLAVLCCNSKCPLLCLTSDFCSEHETSQYQTLVGQLQWLISLGHLDIKVLSCQCLASGNSQRKDILPASRGSLAI